MSYLNTMVLKKSTPDIIAEQIENILNGKEYDSRVLNETYEDPFYRILIESTVDIEAASKEVEDIKNTGIDNNENGFISKIKKIKDKIVSIIMWYNKEDPDDKNALLKAIIKMIISFTITIVTFLCIKNFIITPYVTPTITKIASSQKVTKVITNKSVLNTLTGILSFLIVRGVNLIVGKIRKLIHKNVVIPVKTKANTEEATMVYIENLSRQKEKLERRFKDLDKDVKNTEKVKMLLLMSEYDTQIANLKEMEEYLRKVKTDDEDGEDNAN